MGYKIATGVYPNPFSFNRNTGGSVSAPSAAPVAQQNFPSSAYGQTVPVLYGKARVPGAYVWAPNVIVKTSSSTSFSFATGGFTTDTDVDVILNCRIRFGAPLVPDSTWGLRRLWADGRLILDASTGYRANGLRYRFYDGRSTQGRDPTMVDEEGEENVSAHRGYIDIVIYDFNMGEASQPPVFEAEVVQDAATGADVDSFTTFFADAINTTPAVDWDEGVFYGYSSSAFLIRKFDIGGLREVYAVPFAAGTFNNIEEGSFRYVPEIGRIVALAYTTAAPYYAVAIDPTTGAITAESVLGTPAAPINQTCLLTIGNTALLLGSTFSTEAVFIFTLTASSATRTFLSGSSWEGYATIECMAPGEIRDDTADVWVCADNDLVKLVVSSSGLILSKTVHATFADDPVYCVFHDDDVIVWTDNAQAIRVHGTTGATVWTKAVPYQLEASANLRGLGAPDQNRLDGTFHVQRTTSYDFTNLDTGETASVAKGSASTFRLVYDGEADLSIMTDNGAAPVRIVFDAAGDGTQRNLSDFLEDLMVHGGGFGSSEVDTINIDDVIDGAVIDVTSGVREIARSICEPYSIAIFERAGQIIFKRAATDGAYAVDASVTSTDLVDRGRQAIRARRLNPEEFISRYGINYRDPDEIYQARPQYGEIPTVPFPAAPADNAIKADIPIIVDGDAIKTLATKKVHRLAVERHEFTKGLRAKHADLEPEDIETFTFAGRTVTARIVETTLNPDFSIEVKATEFLKSVAISVSGAVGRPIDPDPVGSPASKYYHLDIPLLAGAHDLAGTGLVQYHVLASAGQTYWGGATLYRDGIAVASQVTNGLAGVALSALPDWDIPYVTELTRSIDVAIISGDTDLLVSKTYLEVMNGANFFAIGQPGRWEVCQVMTLTDNADGTFTFEGLRRGRGSSEEFTGDHAIGDLVVWLSEENVQRLDYTIASLNDAFSFKPVGFGGNLASTPAVSRTVTGEAEKIPKPAHLDAVIDGSDIDLSWVRRARYGAYWVDDGEVEAPLGETLEQYVVRIKDGPAGTVLRTFTVNDATTKTYLAADITTDFGSMPATLTFDVRQVSGTGVVCPTREATITL
jgi:hypothetical protein